MTDVAQELKSIIPKKRRQVHQSFMDVLFRCELQAMYIYLLGIRRPPRAAIHVGSSVHKSGEVNLQSKIDTGELLKRDDAVEIAAATFEEKVDKEPIELDVDEREEGKTVEQAVSEAKDKSVALAGLHYDKVAPVIAPRFVEHPFSINMDRWLRERAKLLHAAGDKEVDSDAAKMLHAEARVMNAASRLGIDLTGTRDVVENVGEGDHGIRDWKTTGKQPNKDVAHVSDQLDIYSLASLTFEKKLPKRVALDFLVYTPKRHDLKYVPRESYRTMDDMNVILFRFARAVHRWFTAIKTGDFAPARPTDWWCSEKWCAFYDRCPAAKKSKLVQIETEVTE